MLKIFSTQLNGLFKRIHDNQTEMIEDGARLLAQALVAEGNIYLMGFGEMAAVTSEAMMGAEPFPGAVVLDSVEKLDELEQMDRVLLVARNSNDQHAVDAAKKLSEGGIPFVAISSHHDTQDESLKDLADIHIDLELKNGLIPGETGGRFGYPYSMAALFVYYGIKWTIEEIVSEYE